MATKKKTQTALYTPLDLIPSAQVVNNIVNNVVAIQCCTAAAMKIKAITHKSCLTFSKRDEEREREQKVHRIVAQQSDAIQRH